MSISDKGSSLRNRINSLENDSGVKTSITAKVTHYKNELEKENRNKKNKTKSDKENKDGGSQMASNHLQKINNHSGLRMKSKEPKNKQYSYTKVFVMGETRFGKLGFLIANPDESVTKFSPQYQENGIVRVPKLCSYNILVKQVACGERHTHLLSHDGYVYSMGNNWHGVLGLGTDEHALT